MVCCEICGKEILGHEKTLKIQIGRKTNSPIKNAFISFWTVPPAEGIAHLQCLDVETSELPEDKEVTFSEICRESLFKLSNYKITEADK